MSWNVDKEPIDYLKQRVKYYRGKKAKTMKWINEPQMINKYGEELLRQIIARRLLTIESLLAQYNKAITDLEKIQENELN